MISSDKMAQDGSQMAPSGGNTNNPAPRINASKNWCFTFNNYNGSKIENFIYDLDKLGHYVFGYETGASGTPHLQGYIEFYLKTRPSELKCLPKQIHWEKRKGTAEQAIDYCIKDGNYQTNMYIRKPVKDPMENLTFKDWQIRILDLIKGPVDERKIYWFWESEGNTGKSTFTKHLIVKYDAVMVTGKGNDIKFIISKRLETKDVEIVIFDLPRISEGHLSYSALEELKNGCMCSGKYEGSSVVFNKPHVIVFANYAPTNYEYLSGDRWEVINIDN